MKKDNRGRKPIAADLLKIRIDIFVEKYIIDKNGGVEATKKIIIDYLKSK